MKVLEILREYIYLEIIIILPIICSITRKISKPLYSNPLIELNDNSFFGTANFIFTNDSKENEIIKNDYNNTRLFIETKNDKIILYFTFSTHKYYEDRDFTFDITLDMNNSSLIINNNSIIFYENLENNLNIVKVKEYNKNLFSNIFSRKEISLKFFVLEYIKNNSNFQCALFFEDICIILNLKKERFTYKFFYLLEMLIDSLILVVLFNYNFWENNFQNICYLFTYVIWAKIQYINFHLSDFFKLGIPILKLLVFYCHLLIYGEFLLSFSDIMTIILLFWKIGTELLISLSIFEIEKKYYYCYNNKISNNQIVIKQSNSKFKHSYLTFIFLLMSIDLPFQSLYMKSIPLILIIAITILYHLTKREVMCQKDNDFCINFYSVGIGLYSYYLLVYNLGNFYKIRPTYAIFPFVLILILYIILIKVIKEKYKFKYVMKKDFERLKKLDKDCCSICLRNFIYDKNKADKFICKVSQDENIYQTTCNHYFHEKCLFLWRKHRNICPVCRLPLLVPKYYFFYDEIPCIYKPNWS